MLLPFSNQLVRLARYIIKDSKDEKKKDSKRTLTGLDEILLNLAQFEHTSEFCCHNVFVFVVRVLFFVVRVEFDVVRNAEAYLEADQAEGDHAHQGEKAEDDPER